MLANMYIIYPVEVVGIMHHSFVFFHPHTKVST